MFENPRRGRQVRNFTTNVPKILVLKWSSEQIFSRKLPLGAPVNFITGERGYGRWDLMITFKPRKRGLFDYQMSKQPLKNVVSILIKDKDIKSYQLL